jgi:hypothetical protein
MCTHKRSKQVTQQDLYEILVGPEWELAARYGEVLNIIFVTLMFSSFIPMLNLLAVANFIGVYTVDKVAFLRLYKRPELYDETIATFASTFMNMAVVMHCAVGMWAYSNVDILQPDASNQNAQTAQVTDLTDNPGTSFVVGTAGSTNPFLAYALPRVLTNSVQAVRLYVCFLFFVMCGLIIKQFFFYSFMKLLYNLGILKEPEGGCENLPT